MTRPLLVDRTLAQRIEAAGTSDLVTLLESTRATGHYPDAVTRPVGGGIALWFCEGNVINGAFGLGMDSPVTDADIDDLVAFHRELGATPSVDICPYADPSLLRALAQRGFVPSGYETVLCQPLPVDGVDGSATRSVTVRIARTDAERHTWAQLEARGFMDEQVDDAGLHLAEAIAARADALHFIGYLDGEPAGTGMLTMRDGWASFNGDATLPAMRGHGVQSAILAERLSVASASGCDLAWIEASPGGVSERNQQRAGFRIAYTRVTLRLPEGR